MRFPSAGPLPAIPNVPFQPVRRPYSVPNLPSNASEPLIRLRRPTPDAPKPLLRLRSTHFCRLEPPLRTCLGLYDNRNPHKQSQLTTKGPSYALPSPPQYHAGRDSHAQDRAGYFGSLLTLAVQVPFSDRLGWSISTNRANRPRRIRDSILCHRN